MQRLRSCALGRACCATPGQVAEAFLVDATGAVKTTTFDAAGRVVSLLYADGKRVTFQYDAAGRRTTQVDYDGPTTDAYSARGELIGKTEPTGLGLRYGAYDRTGFRNIGGSA